MRFDLLDESLFTDLLADAGLFGRMLTAVSDREWVVVDEVQRLPSLLNEVHRQIADRGLRFALLGSSARKLKSGDQGCSGAEAGDPMVESTKCSGGEGN